MNRPLLTLVALLITLPANGQPAENYDYDHASRDLIAAGVQAVLTCNGLFTSQRPVELVETQELAYLSRFRRKAGDAYSVDYERRAVEVGSPGGTPVMRAVHRKGLGCVVLAPDQTLEDIDALPLLDLPPPPGDPAEIPWPNGDLIEPTAAPSDVDMDALQRASDWAFDRPADRQITLSLIVVHRGHIIHERYADGVDMTTRTRTWSTAKSIAGTLIGMLVDDGLIALDEPLGLEWLPAVSGAESDPRNAITLRHVLNMASGLQPVDNGLEYATGSGLAYWAGASSARGARNRGLIREPGTRWDYENYDTLLGVLAMKRAIGDPQAYLEFPRRRLLDRIGMRNTVLSVDRFGDFILSSQVYTNARDLARFGLLYLQNGRWDGERLLSEEWIEFSRTPAPASASRNSDYGGQWWLVPSNRTDVPADAYSTAGNRGQFAIVVPSHDVVIVRRGLDHGRQGFNRWDLTREVLRAIPVRD